MDNFNAKVTFILNVNTNEEKLFKEGEDEYFEPKSASPSPPRMRGSNSIGGATRGIGGSVKSVKRIHQYNTKTEAAESYKVSVRAVQVKIPVIFLKFKGVFTEDELKEKEDEKLKELVEEMRAADEEDAMGGEQSEIEIV